MKIAEIENPDLVIAKDQKEYLPIPCHRFDGEDGRIAFSWKLSFLERLIVLFTGTIWHQVLTFKAKFQPQLLTVKKPEGL